jgi:catecholate siderophore receptor
MKTTTSTPVSSCELMALGALLTLGQAAAAEPTKPAAEPTKEDKPQTLGDLLVEAVRRPLYRPEKLQSTKYTVPLRDVPQTVTVIPQQVIREQNASTLRDVLRNVPGISMQAGEGGGGPAGDNLAIRGFAARSDIFVDGIRDTAGGGYIRDPFNFEQVEVTKGPSSANAGRGSTGGSVNIATKTPHLGSAYELMLGGGSDDFFRSTLDVNQEIPEIKGAALRVNGLYHDQDIPGRDQVENERSGIAISLAVGLETDSRAFLSYSHLAQHNMPDYGIPWISRAKAAGLGVPPGIPLVPFSNFYGNLNRDYENTTTDILTSTVEHDFNGDLKLRNVSRFGRNDRDSITTAPRFTNATNGSSMVNQQFQSRDQIDTSFANQTELRCDLETGPLEHQLVGGIEISHETSKNHPRIISNTTSTDLYNPGNWNGVTPGSISYFGVGGGATTVGIDTLSAYVFDTLKIDRQWEINGGLRFDHLDTQYESAVGPSAASLLAGNRSYETFKSGQDLLSYRAALIYKPLDNGTIYLGYGTSFNASGENLAFIPHPVRFNFGTTVRNSTLSLLAADAEENTTTELGTKWELFDKKLLLTGALFQTIKTNARTTDPVTPDIVSLDGEQRVHGVELGLTGEINDHWRLTGGYTYLEGSVTDSANPAERDQDLGNTPKHSFSLWSIHELPGHVELGLGTQYVGERYNNTNFTTRQQAPDYLLFDAMIGYELNEHVSFRLNINNLLDRGYIDRVGGGHFVPGQGRSFILSTNITF